MGIDRRRVSVDEGLKNIFAIELRGLSNQALIALFQGIGDNGILLARETQGQPVVLDALAPKFCEFSFGRRPLGLFTVEVEGFIHLKVHRHVEQLRRESDARFHALPITDEYLVDRIKVRISQVIV